MDFILTEEQKQIKALMRDFCKKEILAGSLVQATDLVFLGLLGIRLCLPDICL